MTYKKSWLSCLLWVLFTCFTGVLLADYTISIWLQGPGIDTGAAMAAMVLVVFTCAAVICFGLRKIYNAVTLKQITNVRAVIILENLAVFAILAAGLGLRIYLCMQSSADRLNVTSYYELAAVTAGKEQADYIHNISDLYTLCLSTALSFLGNKLMAGVWLQIVLQMLTVILGFLAVRTLAGKLTAYVAMLFLSFSSVYNERIFVMTPEVFSFFLYLLALFIIGRYVKNYCFDRYQAKGAVFSSLACGCMIGLLFYLDALFITLLVIPAGLIGAICTKKEDTSSAKTLPVFLLLLVVSSAGLVLMGLFAYGAYVDGGTIAAYAGNWFAFNVHLPLKTTTYSPAYMPAYMPYITRFSIIECFVLVFLAAFLIMSFWFRPKVQNAAQWIVLALLFGAPHLTTETPGYQIYSLFMWSVLAGIGLQQCFTKNRMPRVQKAAAAQTVTEPETPVGPEDSPAPETAPMENEPMQEPETDKTESKPRFIENPLPLPKKHEKKAMEYQYELDESKLDFDVEIAENDDFDV